MKRKLLISAFVAVVGFITAQGLAAQSLAAQGGQNVKIPDRAFKACLIGDPAINTNGDTEISVAEAQAFTGGIQCYAKNISDLTGIEAFVNITALDCSNNQLISLDISNNTALESLYCSNNQLSNLNISNNTALELLYCSDNQLSSLDINNNTALKQLYCSGNQLSSLDINNNTALEIFNCSNNQLSSLDINNNTALRVLDCSNNQLRSLDISNNTALRVLDCSNNQLSSLNLKNGNNRNLGHINLTDNPNLRCIQVDDVAYINENWSDDAEAYYSTDAEVYFSAETYFSKDAEAYFSENCR